MSLCLTLGATCLASPLPHLYIPGSLCTFKQELVKLPDLDLNLRSSCLSFPGSWDDRPVPSGTSFSAHPLLLYWSACERTHVCVHVERSAASILLNHLLLWVCRCVSVWAYVHTFVCVRMWAALVCVERPEEEVRRPALSLLPSPLLFVTISLEPGAHWSS